VHEAPVRFLGGRHGLKFFGERTQAFTGAQESVARAQREHRAGIGEQRRRDDERQQRKRILNGEVGHVGGSMTMP
jgi:hypothetical protein